MPPHDRITRTDGDAVLQTRGLGYGYRPGEPVTENLGLTLIAGRVTVLLGPNASGKTTLLRLLMGQLTPWSGTVLLDGEPLDRLSGPTLARRVSYVPQRGGASFGYSVRQAVSMGRFAHRDHRHVDEAMQRCGVDDLAERPFTELSGGQQQRVLIARAWAQSRGEGRAVLADEPASSLDLKHAWEAMALLREMAEEGLAVLVVVHSLDLAKRWADTVWLMDGGRVVAEGPNEAVLTPSMLEPVYGMRLQTLDDGTRRALYVDAPIQTTSGG